MYSLRTSVGSMDNVIGIPCTDLYVEIVVIPRIHSLSSLQVYCCSHFFGAHRRTRRFARLLPNNVVLSMSNNDYFQSQKRWFACFLVTTVIWITIFLYTFNSFTSIPSTSMGAAQARPRIVFKGDGFDIIYVIIPRIYQDKTVKIPSWLVEDVTTLTRSAIETSSYHTKLKVIVLDTDFGPASNVLGTLLVEQDSDTIIFMRVLYYTHKYPNDAIAVLGGWISAEDRFYCGRSLAVGLNSVSFVGGAGGVAVKQKFYGLGKATLPVFQVANMSKACFLGDDYYLSYLSSRNSVRRRIVSDSCWNIKVLTESFTVRELSSSPSKHPGGANVEHYQQCIRLLGQDKDLSQDGEFVFLYMFLLSRAWGILYGFMSLYSKGEFITC
ncbi:hypothetical protein PsorP6_012954 [Peronosclerospora sorghi]|uniref:Uncharacterized protein n=1 Tax=Peronosclerospora sorghi TaxID=230839 RepID=A0ACC0WJM9_9STRA|nr:hypothetical protein PsorP6_012954 [Peronosclerospora sorghi]